MIDKYNPRENPPENKFAAFGIPYLDNMSGGMGEKAEREEDYDTRGLPCGSTTALIGDALTQKSQLGKAFLSRAFFSCLKELTILINEAADNSCTKELETEIKALITKKTGQIVKDTSSEEENLTEDIIKETGKRIKDHIENQKKEVRDRLKAIGEHHPVAVMFTTQDVNNKNLSNEFYEWLKEAETKLDSGGGKKTDSKNTLKEQREKIKNLESQFRSYLMAKDFGNDFQDFISSYSKNLKEYLKRKTFENELKKHIKDHTICRRFEIHDISAPTLMHTFQRNIEKAQRIAFDKKEDEPLPEAGERFRESWRIRVVVDDLNSFRNTYPEMREDPLMLPSLLFLLDREGVTSLIIDTQTSGSPELPITERFDSSVRELVHQRIYSWRLPFYGENRVAISLIPPISNEYRGVIRELRWETRDERKTDLSLTVDPHFELYMGLEKGQPQPVPLEVRLYAETPNFKKYIETEERFFREAFTPVISPTKQGEPCVISWAEATEYDALRDSCYLQRDTRIDHTTILQVDEFWWLRRAKQRRAGAFRQQWNYLSALTATSKDGKNFESDLVADPFGVFQPPASQEKHYSDSTTQQDSPKEQTTQQKPIQESAKKQDPAKEKRRLDFFDDDCGYDFMRIKEDKNNHEKKTEEEQYIDRVPFTWDFGFLLCKGWAWEEAFDLKIGKKKVSVRDVWGRLNKANQESQLPKPVSWREFLEASKIVAEFQYYRTSTPATTFDFTMLMPESFSCLILEMWLSESYNSLSKYKNKSGGGKKDEFEQKRKRIVERVSQRRWEWDTSKLPSRNLLRVLQNEREHTLTKILEMRKSDKTVKGYSLELYKVWLLLIEAINFAELVDSSSHLNFEFKSRDVNPQAVSARHWYKTASKFIDSLTLEQLEYNWVPVRLPGHFSVRADWFLAVAGGSRSSRLADHALDLLSSKRANVTRLQEGIGLPTRTLFDKDSDLSHLRTRLISIPKKGSPLENVEYEKLRQIGANNSETKSRDEEFYWLWRSGIWAYNRHSRIWHKWLNRTLLWWHSLRQRYGSNWTSGFEVYDLLTEIEFGNKDLSKITEKELESWKHFHEMRDILIAELEQVSIFTT